MAEQDLKQAIANLSARIKDEQWAVMFSSKIGYLSTVNRMEKGRALAPAPMDYPVKIGGNIQPQI
ncbi:MAG: hypothetical protein JGK17_10320 [Microcoleus sp. PH2017_10_PVI_O_A]|uniref:hypothetical protein n=1 Tax=unclassified Microcoleus TaxID=2642155 RepID=UPI001D9597CA|nr:MULTISPECIES: hypothetical protein [unclassified Microcoleus]TAE83766.1 MAG: hypothetical protein EAZ83_08620 [Oscillatoriales cyanobacterium]MCC3405967.1 hypothetical protein [Microcoleus sp. PH2017_10_PVI_O_A]MCC3459942.1 hypothetical protein [Microcoleus sp. PH2017_11_PCY_U_A]MCC3478456.1 hypothetical protein [Microcoleus sp. PH2017_12_PCY_D_A]MCC3527916.1 hypothetical protein [Microcoleus sp. PH2017_21_RUC_O_A]